MKLYNLDPSPNSRVVRAVAYELGIPLEIVHVNFREREHKQPEFLQKNPNGKMPVLEDGTFYLWESHAILIYLAQQKPERGFYPSDPKQSAHLNQWLFWYSEHLKPVLRKITYEKLLKPMVFKQETNIGMVQDEMERFRPLARILNQHLAGRRYLLDQLTIVDFSAVSYMAYRQMLGLPMEDYPYIQSWLARIEARESWKKSESNIWSSSYSFLKTDGAWGDWHSYRV